MNWNDLKEKLINSKWYYFHTENGVLLCGDCFDIIPNLPDEIIDLIIIDPPYLTTKETWDKKEVVNEFLSGQLFRIAKEHASLYVWCGIGEKSQSLIRWFPIFNKDWHFKDLITWKKQRGIGMRKGWLYTREEIMWFVKNNKKFIWRKECQYSDEKRKSQKFGFEVWKRGKRPLSQYYRLTDVWTDISETTWNWKSLETLHYTPKPLKAIERIIKVHTYENEIVFDCFLGSGTTAVACEKLNRRWIGIEINPEYCEIAKQRIIKCLRER